ncbi:hypothetical protein Y1Q_0000085 [Alligator mississippiensis]|uniref:Uncharacterized protein n=1 Tax=Alligator mississippiensis TaxID=8496 RepID=A0A151NQT9_ALLMI|nr:hypothetical protein Y1Q_0000085 [Alligator mississippiensis]
MAMWHPGEQIKEVVRVGEGKDYKQVWQLEEDFFFCNAAYVLSSTADSHGPLGKSSASHRLCLDCAYQQNHSCEAEK